MTVRERTLVDIPMPEGWESLDAAGLWARGLEIPRSEVAYWKHLYESFEHVAIVRTARNVEDDGAIVAIIAPPDFVGEAQAILDDVLSCGTHRVEDAPLPDECREDWFLLEWAHA